MNPVENPKMNPETPETISITQSADEGAVRALYQQAMASWNTRDAATFAAPFSDDAEVIGIDGSQSTAVRW
jgi:hypothetical protein